MDAAGGPVGDRSGPYRRLAISDDDDGQSHDDGCPHHDCARYDGRSDHDRCAWYTPALMTAWIGLEAGLARHERAASFRWLQ